MHGLANLLLVGICAHGACATSRVDVEVRSEPVGCLVYVDGEFAGTAPCVVSLVHKRDSYSCPTPDTPTGGGGLSELPWGLFTWLCSADAAARAIACDQSRRGSGGRWVELRCEFASEDEPKRRSGSYWINTADPPAGPITIEVDATEPAAATNGGRQ